MTTWSWAQILILTAACLEIGLIGGIPLGWYLARRYHALPVDEHDEDPAAHDAAP